MAHCPRSCYVCYTAYTWNGLFHCDDCDEDHRACQMMSLSRRECRECYRRYIIETNDEIFKPCTLYEDIISHTKKKLRGTLLLAVYVDV